MGRIVICIFFALGLQADDARVEFNRDVRPILSDKCFACHGADAKAKGIPLRLDSEEEAKRRAIVPGNVAASRLAARISSGNQALRMPPVAAGVALTEREIATLKNWIAQGAPWQQHWSFLAPVRRPGSIDDFVRERLRREGLAMSPPASRETLLRRVTLDLTGLPPTPGEVDAFLKDRDYGKAVDRLLASPRFGERMAARWMDAARYADTNGYQYDGERLMWRWRDYVINSFNANKPFDVFTVEQIAGDMLPGATFEQRLGSGFNRNHRGNTEDGIVPEEYAVEYVVDRVETTSAVFMGLTLGCARCHNHKYDPVTQKEFYQMFAYFNNVPERGRAMKYGNSPPLMAAPTAGQRAALDALEARMRALAPSLRVDAAALAAWGKSAPAERWAPTGFVDGQAGQFDIESQFTISAWVNGNGMVGARKANDSPRAKGYSLQVVDGRVFFEMTSVWETDSLRVRSEAALMPGVPHHVVVTYGGTRMAEDALVYVDGKLAPVKVESDNLYRPFNNAGGRFGAAFKVGGGVGFRGKLEDVRTYGRVLEPDEIQMMAVGETVAAIAAKPSRSTLEQRQLELSYLEKTAPAWADWSRLREERWRLERQFPTSMVMAESLEPKQTHLLIRGAYDKPGEVVIAGLPAVLPPLPKGAPNNRLGLAKWMVDRSNPLTARVTVNRFWQMLFGTGIVKTAEDFGQQGEWPTHPELLDALAVDFMDSGWNVKALLRQIVMSETYRQASKATPELLAKDPENRLLARGPRLRLPAEMVRDVALFEAGLLREEIGGPSVKPYQPEGLWKEVIMQDFEYKQAKGKDLYRRSLYTFWKRTSAPPMMMNFDASQREACMVRENRTNTPLQALNLMNDVTFLEAARFVGQRMLLEGGATADDRLRHGFRLVLSRAPSAAEMAVLRGSLAYHLDYFASRPEAYVAHGDSPADASLGKRELAAYMAVASLLFNTDEAITKE